MVNVATVLEMINAKISSYLIVVRTSTAVLVAGMFNAARTSILGRKYFRELALMVEPCGNWRAASAAITDSNITSSRKNGLRTQSVLVNPIIVLGV
jgi:hypothetical protein